jgi:hypothetical protein
VIHFTGALSQFLESVEHDVDPFGRWPRGIGLCAWPGFEATPIPPSPMGAVIS